MQTFPRRRPKSSRIAAIAFALLTIGAAAVPRPAPAADQVDNVVLAIHGGIARPKSQLTPEVQAATRAALREALQAGYAALTAPDDGNTSGRRVAAVLAAVKSMEDSEYFNAGKGAVFNKAGVIELDAAIMDGADRKAGAVAAVKRIRNPVAAALAVMRDTRHVMIVGDEADRFAAAQGLEIVEKDYFRTERRWQQYQELLRRAAETPTPDESKPAANGKEPGTVGAVALDASGNLAAALSTGGLAFKLPGRVGDSATIGAGIYSDSRTCAVAATGDGELFIRSCFAYDISARMRYRNDKSADAADEVIRQVHDMGGEGGLVVLDHSGHLSLPYAAAGMYRGYVTRAGEIVVKLYED